MKSGSFAWSPTEGEIIPNVEGTVTVSCESACTDAESVKLKLPGVLSPVHDAEVTAPKGVEDTA